MKTSILTFDQVSKEIKTKISKIGKDALVKRFTEGKLTSQEEVVAASYYLLKRKSMTQKEINKIEALEYVLLFHPLEETPPAPTEEEKVAREKNDKGIADLADYSAQESTMRSKGSEKKITDEVKRKEDKPAAEPVIKLTAQEFPLFERIRKSYLKLKTDTIEISKFLKKDESVREFKGVLGSLMKKGIVSYTATELTIQQLGLDMIFGNMIYKQKAKNEQNFFTKKRVVINVDGKDYEKSAYVRALLRKNNKITCAELNVKLAEVGFSQLYHSELQRCKNQLGIVTVKDED